jgi:transcriptional regulator
MYVPKHFEETDREILLDLIDDYGFATVISWGAAEPQVTHVPLMVDRQVKGQERLLGHFARANPHWSAFDGTQPALAIFHGPHAYVSPAWYSEHPSVPTWSYAVVHAYGKPQVVDDAATWSILQRLIEKLEKPRENRWPAELPQEFVTKKLKAIVGFEIPIDRLEGKFKLGQNKSATDQAGAFAGLASETSAEGQALAKFAEQYFGRRPGG